MTTITIEGGIKNNDLVAIPRREYDKLSHLSSLISEDQIWFWSKEWQAKEREADSDMKAGRISGPYRNTVELKKALAKLKRPIK